MPQLLSGAGLPGLRLSAPSLVDLPNGPGTTLACLRSALLLVTDRAGRYVLMVAGPSEHEQGLRLDVAGLTVPQAQSLLAELDDLRSQLNVYHGHLLEVSPTAMGGVALHFADIPTTAREDVVLPEPVLRRIERHALEVATHRTALRSAGQHLKRGLLLFGPPGTGKTHTTRYLVTHMPEYTGLMMSGRSLHAIGSVAELARKLQPVVLLEDVDLVAEDRSVGPSGNSVLFDLLDAMDGAAGDADLLFLLTTNRADLLEPALAARPGRVDVAVEIGLPDAQARHRLLLLYARELPLQLDEEDVARIIQRTEGVTASFPKELLRRAALEALLADARQSAINAVHMGLALDDLLDSAQQVTRTLLGVDFDPSASQPLGGPGAVPSPAVLHGGRPTGRWGRQSWGMTFEGP